MDEAGSMESHAMASTVIALRKVAIGHIPSAGDIEGQYAVAPDEQLEAQLDFFWRFFCGCRGGRRRKRRGVQAPP
jgi:hypothetical protein